MAKHSSGEETCTNDTRRRFPRHMRKEAASVQPPAFVFVVAFFVIVLVPLVCIPFAKEDVSAEKRDLAEPPSLMVDGAPNLNVLSDTGDWFADHFAFRGTFVDLDATIKQRLLMTSSTDNVVVGNSGWLFYSGTLNDYQRRNHMSDHELLNIATNLALMQEYVTAQGKGFAIAIAPNKNSLYPSHMPYYEVEGEGESNLQRLLPLLADKGVSSCNLLETFGAQDKVLYYERDSHWNTEGALLAYSSISPMLRTPLRNLDEATWVAGDHVGDVDSMLHPQTARPEDDPQVVDENEWSFANEATSVEDDKIQTTSAVAGAAGSLVMYRDSFGNNLIPYFASAYGRATFTKLVPYDMGRAAIADADDVVVERAERHVDLFATKPPYLPAPERSIAGETDVREGATTVRLSTNGPYLVAEGTIDEACAEETDAIFVQLIGLDGARRTVEAFHVSEGVQGTQDFEGAEENAEPTIQGDWGYRAFIPMGEQGVSAYEGVRVLVGSQETASEVAQAPIK